MIESLVHTWLFCFAHLQNGVMDVEEDAQNAGSG